MKRLWLLLMAIMLLVFVGRVCGQTESKLEVLDTGFLLSIDGFAPKQYSRIHDKASGVEILCFRDGGTAAFKSPIACVVTGRKW